MTFANLNDVLPDGPLDIRGAFFDSCPGDDNVACGAVAFSVGIKNVVVRTTTYASIYALFVGWKFLYNQILRRPTPIGRLRTGTLSSTAIPLSAKRTYVYSTIDRLIDYTAVEAHAEEAKALGADVLLRKSSTAAHVGHLKEDPEGYRALVKETWERARL